MGQRKSQLWHSVIVGGVAFVVMAIVVHLGVLFLSPDWSTDHQIAEGLRRGGRMNALIYAKPPRAGATSVPLANPDTLSTRAYLDLRKGPLIVEGVRPHSCTYWSASVFARNTDTVLIRSDRDSPDGRISIGLGTAQQHVAEPVKDEAILPSTEGVVLLRCFIRDRTDKAYVTALEAESRGLVMRPAKEARS